MFKLKIELLFPFKVLFNGEFLNLRIGEMHLRNSGTFLSFSVGLLKTFATNHNHAIVFIYANYVCPSTFEATTSNILFRSSVTKAKSLRFCGFKFPTFGQ